jgi:DNA primase
MTVETEIASVVHQFLDKVKPTGSENLMGVCPFHVRPDGTPERTPSFAISVTTGLYFCHSCKERGNFRQFLRAMGVSHYAMHKQYGLLLSATSSSTHCAVPNPARARRATVSEPLPESILGIFDKCPLDLVADGFLERTLQDFDVGFDEYNMRITFPLRDMAGRLMGISGRSVVDHGRRFKVYDTEYERWGLPPRKISMGEILWNADRVYPEVYFGNNVPIVVVEGFKGCMWVHQAGIKNVVALCGSYLKDGQKWLLEHLGGIVYVMMDNDDSGQSGAQQVGAALSQSLKVRMATFRSSAKQPTDLDPPEVIDAINRAEDYYLWAIRNGLSPIKEGQYNGIR